MHLQSHVPTGFRTWNGYFLPSFLASPGNNGITEIRVIIERRAATCLSLLDGPPRTTGNSGCLDQKQKSLAGFLPDASLKIIALAPTLPPGVSSVSQHEALCMCYLPLILTTAPWDRCCYYPHFRDDETQRG